MLLNKARSTIARYDMLKKHDRVLVGVSGGCDSITLLHILNFLKKEFNLNLYAAHLNHMIRKEAAREDALFVKKTAEKLNLPVIVEAEDIPRLAKDFRLSIETAARNARYDFYLRAARRFNANKIALGHTEDDQAETVLIRLIRGSGLLGLSGIPPVRHIEGRTIIRPLIEISKDEVKRFLKTRKIPFREDITNIQPIYLRNRIRHKLIPFLEKEFNPAIKRALTSTGKNLIVDYDYLLKITEKKFRRYAGIGKEKAVIDLKFLKEDIAIQRMIIREAIKKVKGNLDAVTYSHWEDLNDLLGRRSRWSLNLPGGILVKRVKDALIFYKKEIQKEKADLTDVFYQLNIPGRTGIPEIEKVLEADFVKRHPAFGGKKSKKEEYFDFTNLKPPLFIRFRKSGDKIVPLGMIKSKRIKQLFIDEKVPIEKRDKVPLVLSGDKIIWVCGIKRSNCAKVTGATRKILRLKYMAANKINKLKKAFTLMEILVVVAILGLLTSIAFSNIQNYRNKAQKYTCIANLREIDSHISLWAIDNGKTGNATVEMSDLVPAYLKTTPYCPLDSDKQGYILTTVSGRPRCPRDPDRHFID